MQPTLYIIMRNDIFDGTPGKMMAQAAHAQADFDKKISRVIQDIDYREYEGLLENYNKWIEDRNFGRTIVLSGTEDDIDRISYKGALAGFTVDPSYPWRNYYGEMFVTEEVTCGWIFVCDAYESDLALVKDLPLHK
jgi:hypothetical protein